MPNALARLLGAMLGISPKQAKRPAAGTPAEPEAVPVEQEVELPMPEMNALPPEGPQEKAPEEIAGSMEQRETPANEATRRAADILAKALSDAEAVLVSAVPEHAPEGGPPEDAKPPEPPPPPAPSTLDQIQDLLRTLTEHFDRALDRMADERRILIDEAQSAGRSAREQTDRALDRMEQDRRDLTEQVSTLARALERLEHRLDDLSRAVLESRRVPITVAIEEEAPPPPPEETEPAFAPGGEGLTLVISAVPGFQGLMEVQRALTRISAIEGASVERYFDGEARIVLTLREPITAGRLLETLVQATGQQLQLEESRPESMRMRVRFQGPAT
jgi:hypothetical protein